NCSAERLQTKPTHATSATSGSGLAAIQGEPPCVYRLDARVGLRADVSNALLRLLAESRSEKILLADHLVAARRHVARAAVCFSRGGLFCAGHGTFARKGSRTQRHRQADHAAARGKFAS